tara:strand:+ start:44 stop:715 length:672 start_codon:yes stop_codon:yes gene_type:complete
MSVDIAGAELFARKLAEKTHPLCLLAPPLNFGISIHHMPFPGTLTLQPETFETVLLEVAASLQTHGIRRILVVNGHGGNQHALATASVKMRRDLGIRMAYTLWPMLGGGKLGDLVKGRRIGHACVFETSMMMHLRPDLVRQDALAEGEMQPPIYGNVATAGIDGFVYWNELTANGAFQGAPDATAEAGEKITEAALEKLAAFVTGFAEVAVDDSPGIIPKVSG